MTKLNWSKISKAKLVVERGYEVEVGVAAETRRGWSVVTGRDERQYITLCGGVQTQRPSKRWS